MNIIVTGGAGFIGSAVIRRLIGATDWRVVNVDKLTYAGNLESLASVQANPRYRFVHADICDGPAMAGIFASVRPDAVLHLAAESHVDRSIDGAAPFIETNIAGTYTLLETALAYWRTLPPAAQRAFRFQHISTDEVYGSLGATGLFTEDTPYRPNSPYSASKAASDHLARAWHHTYGLPVLITNCSNNYGPYHFPEKLIPLLIVRALRGQAMPVYGRGENVRDWLYVDDHAEALQAVLEHGRPGEVYNIGARNEWRNIDLVRKLCALLDEALPHAPHRPHEKLIEFVGDRPGHDLRYAIDPSKIERELGWRPRVTMDDGLRRTVRWFLDNQQWWQRVLDGSYRGERLGLDPKLDPKPSASAQR